jgi:hypothetical protein
MDRSESTGKVSPMVAICRHHKPRETLKDRVRLGSLVENQLGQLNAKRSTIPLADEVWRISPGRDECRVGCVATRAESSCVIKLESSQVLTLLSFARSMGLETLRPFVPDDRYRRRIAVGSPKPDYDGSTAAHRPGKHMRHGHAFIQLDRHHEEGAHPRQRLVSRVLRWTRIVPGRDGVLVADASILAVDDGFPAANVAQDLLRPSLCLGLRVVVGRSAISTRLFHIPAAARVLHDVAFLFRHRSPSDPGSSPGCRPA